MQVGPCTAFSLPGGGGLPCLGKVTDRGRSGCFGNKAPHGWTLLHTALLTAFSTNVLAHSPGAHRSGPRAIFTDALYGLKRFRAVSGASGAKLISHLIASISRAQPFRSL